MKNLLAYIICFSLAVPNVMSPSYAEQVVFVEKGQPAPFTGFLMDREKAIKFNDLDLNYTFSLKNIEVLKYQNGLFEEQLTKNNQHIQELNKQLIDNKSDSMWTKIGFFMLGAALTGFIAYGTVQAIR